MPLHSPGADLTTHIPPWLYLAFLLLQLALPVSAYLGAEQFHPGDGFLGWSTYTTFPNSSTHPNTLIPAPIKFNPFNTQVRNIQTMLLTYGHVDPPSGSSELTDMLLPLGFSIAGPEMAILVPPATDPAKYTCPYGLCSTMEECTPFYHCLLEQLPLRSEKLDWTVDLADTLPRCLNGTPIAPGDQQQEPVRHQTQKRKRQLQLPTTPTQPAGPFQCLLTIVNTTDVYPNIPCTNSSYTPSPQNWVEHNVDANLQTFIKGGADSEGLWWGTTGDNETFAQALGRKMGKSAFDCSLRLPCQPAADLDCASIGVLQAPFKESIIQSEWGYLALTALENISGHLSSRFGALDTLDVSAMLDGFKIDDFTPKGGWKFKDMSFLAGIAPTYLVAAGFAPPNIETATISGAPVPHDSILPELSAFFSQQFGGSMAEDLDTEAFVEEVTKVVTTMKGGLDSVVTALFSGAPAFNNKGLLNMLQGGVWADPNNLAPATPDIAQQLKIEALSRAINELWKIGTSNKRWVLFVDLADNIVTKEKCLADTTGPQDLKYCDDGGVYYAYNYVEDGDLKGHVDYPWGAQKLGELGIDMRWITEASAKTYRLAKDPNNNLDPFNASFVDTTPAFLTILYKMNTSVDLSAYAGRYAGSWTLPVCDASTWGAQWNYDWQTGKGGYPTFAPGFPPCMCGQGGAETAAWANAAGMHNFKTYYNWCSNQLKSEYFTQWPEGVTQVDLGFGDPLKKHGT